MLQENTPTPTQLKAPSSTLRKRQRSLPSLGIRHAMHPHIIPHLDIVHALRRDEDKLPAHTPPGRLDHHRHTRRAIHTVHEDIKFVQTADGRTHGFPDTE